MYKIVSKKELTPNVKMFEIHAPAVAHKAEPGQFVIIRYKESGERIPMTIAGTDLEAGTVTIYFAEVGKSSTELGLLKKGDEMPNFTGNEAERRALIAYFQSLVEGGGE